MFQWTERIVERYIRKNVSSSLDKYVLYKIVDSNTDDEIEFFQIQCVNTKAILSYTLIEIIYDIKVLYGLHPIQGCFIGIEYGKNLRASKEFSNRKPNGPVLTRDSLWRYGNYNLLYQNRDGLVAFHSEYDSINDVLVMDPRDIALTKEIITEFDASQAFYIGIFAGLRLGNPKLSQIKPQRHLQLVKI